MRAFPADGRGIRQLAYTPDGRHLVVAGRGAAGLVWWDWLAGTASRRLYLLDVLPAEARGEIDAPLEIGFRTDPARVVTAWEWTGQENCLHVHDPDHEREVGIRITYRTRYHAFAISPDGQRIVSRGMYARADAGCLEVWQPEGAGDLVRIFDWRGDDWDEWDETGALAYDGRHVASVGPRRTTLRLWDTYATPPNDGGPWDLEEVDPDACVDSDIGYLPRALAFADNAPGLAVGGDGLGVYDLGTGRWRALERDREMVHAVALTDDGRHLLAGTESGAVELWDVAAGRLVRQLTWDHGPVTAVAFAPDGQTCAAGTATGWVVVWDRDG